MDVGRMAVIADPTGAALCLWEPRAHIGATLVNSPGSMTWNDLATPDPEAAVDFYGKLFGWTFEEVPESAAGYRVIGNGDRSNGGIFPVEGPSNWMPYFGHDDVEPARERDRRPRRQALQRSHAHVAGTIAVLGDPQGAVFAVWTGHYDD